MSPPPPTAWAWSEGLEVLSSCCPSPQREGPRTLSFAFNFVCLTLRQQMGISEGKRCFPQIGQETLLQCESPSCLKATSTCLVQLSAIAYLWIFDICQHGNLLSGWLLYLFPPFLECQALKSENSFLFVYVFINYMEISWGFCCCCCAIVFSDTNWSSRKSWQSNTGVLSIIHILCATDQS